MHKLIVTALAATALSTSAAYAADDHATQYSGGTPASTAGTPVGLNDVEIQKKQRYEQELAAERARGEAAHQAELAKQRAAKEAAAKAEHEAHLAAQEKERAAKKEAAEKLRAEKEAAAKAKKEAVEKERAAREAANKAKKEAAAKERAARDAAKAKERAAKEAAKKEHATKDPVKPVKDVPLISTTPTPAGLTDAEERKQKIRQEAEERAAANRVHNDAQ